MYRFLRLLAFLTFLITVTPTIPHCEDYPSDLDKWVSLSALKCSSLQWDVANSSHLEWSVFMAGEKVYARRLQNPEGPRGDFPPFLIPLANHTRGRRIGIRVEDGWLVGFNAAEWGGSLWWYSLDGRQQYKISDDQIVQFVKMSDGLFALEGLAHLSLSEGKVIKLSKNGPNSSWNSSLWVELPQAPDAGVVHKDGSLIIVTTSGLVRVIKQRKVETLLEKTFWWGMYPNSVLIDTNNFVFIGMRQGILKWRIGDLPDTMIWLVPSKEFLFEQ